MTAPMVRACPVCGGAPARVLFRQEFAAVESATPVTGYDVVTCSDCGCGYADGIPDQRAFDRYYREMSKYEYHQRDGAESEFDKRRLALIADIIAPHVPHAGARILDIGCGTGVLLQRALGADPSRCAMGVDVTHNMLLRARARLAPQVALVEASADALPMRAASVDLVVSTSALHYMDDPITVLREARRVLAPGGSIVLSDWCRDFWTMRALDRVLTWVDPAHVHTLRGDALVASLNSAGFSSARLTRIKIDAFWGIMTVSAVVREAT